MVALLAAYIFSARTQAPAPILIQHVNVIDCAGSRVRTNADVLVSGGRIARIERQIQPELNQKVVDGTGKYLIPGLWDMHVHGTGVPGFLGIYLANGVTGVRDMFDPSGTTANLREATKNGKVIGPHIVCAGRIVDGPKPIWPGSVAVSNPEEGRVAVTTVLSQGSDFVKVYSLLPRDAFLAIADECKKRHVVFAGHVPESVTAAEASDAGQKSFEHLYGILRGCSNSTTNLARTRFTGMTAEQLRPMLKELLGHYDESRAQALFAKLKRNGSWQCPTFTVLYSIQHPKDPRTADQWRFDYLPSWMRGIWSTTSARAKDWMPEDDVLEDQLFKKDLEVVGKMSRAGVPILAGTDVMNPYCMPGFSLHDELQWLVRAGLRPVDALRAATINPAIYFGIQKDYGTIQVGKIADLVLLDANPLVDIRNTSKIDQVFLGGHQFDREALKKLMPKTTRTASVVPKTIPAGAIGDDDVPF